MYEYPQTVCERYDSYKNIDVLASKNFIDGTDMYVHLAETCVQE
jgi:hypothetical protein